MDRRILAFLSRARRSWFGVVALVIVLGAFAGVVLLLQTFGPDLLPAASGDRPSRPLRVIVEIAPVVCLAAIFFLASAILDVRSEFLKTDWPVTRIVIGAASLAALFAYMQWGMYGELLWVWIAGAAAFGGGMAWLGWRWMKYVDF